jgi:hypothetical protein
MNSLTEVSTIESSAHINISSIPFHSIGLLTIIGPMLRFDPDYSFRLTVFIVGIPISFNN